MPGKLLPTHKLFGLDHLRAVAIIFVFVYHYGVLFGHPEWIRAISTFGWSGVDLFFVLSGYLISSQLFATISRGKKISFKIFFLKRFFRIIPAYMVVLALYFLFPFLREREALAPLWKYVTFTQNIGLDSRTHGTFSHAWSLCIEEQFYLLLPLTLMALVYVKATKRAYILLIFLFAAGLVIRWYCWHYVVAPFAGSDLFWANWQEWVYYPTYTRLDGLVAGVSLAALLQFQPKIRDRLQPYGNHIIVISLLIFTGMYFVFTGQQTFSATVFGIPSVDFSYGLLVLGALCPSGFLYKFKSSVTSYIAALSYALYLSHKRIIHVTQEEFAKLHIAKDSNLMFIICIATSIAGAVVLNTLIEKPFLRLRGKILKRW